MPDPTITNLDGTPANLSPAELVDVTAQAAARAAAASAEPVSNILDPYKSPSYTAEDGKPVSPAEAAAVRKQAGVIDPMLDMTPQEMADLQHQAPDKFNMQLALTTRTDLGKDPAALQRVADAHNLLAQAPKTREDWERVFTGAPGAVGGFLSSVWGNIKKAAEIDPNQIVSKLIAGAVYGKTAPSAAEATRDVLEAIATSHAGLTGLANQGTDLVRQGVKTAKDALFDPGKAAMLATEAVNPVAKLADTFLPKEKPELTGTPQDRVIHLGIDMAQNQHLKDMVAGRAGILEAPEVDKLRDWVAAQGYPVRPEVISENLAAEPTTMLAQYMLFKGAGAVLPEAIPEAALTQMGATAAKMGGRAVSATAAPLAGAAGLVAKATPFTGAVLAAKKVLTGDFLEALGSWKVAEEGAHKLLKLRTKLQNLENVGKQIAGSEPVASNFAQLAKDVFEAAPGAAYETAKGGLFDVATAAGSEEPQEGQGVGIGTAFGLFGGAMRTGGHALSGQLIAPREYGIATPVRPVNNFPSLNAIHDAAYANAEPAVKARLNALQAQAKSLGAQLVYSDRPTAGAPDPLVAALSALKQPDGTPAVSPERAQQLADAAGVFPKLDVGGKRLILAREVGAAPHEIVGHALEDVLGESIMRGVDQMIQSDPKYQGQTWQNIAQNYASKFTDKTGNPLWDPTQESWQDFLLGSKVSAWGELNAKEKLLRQTVGEGPYTKGQANQVWSDYLGQHPEINPNDAWKTVLTPPELQEVANRYISREVFAENAQAVFEHGLSPDPAMTAKIARVVGRFVRAFGGDPVADRYSKSLGFPLSYDVLKAHTGLLTAKTGIGGEARPVIEPPKLPKGGVGGMLGVPQSPEEQQKAAEDARKIASGAPTTPAVPGGKSMQEILGQIAEIIASRGSGRVDYSEAPGQPAGSIWSGQKARKAAIDFYNNVPEDQRALWAKIFTPERILKTGAGNYQVLAWSPEVLFSNAHKTAATLADLIAKDPANRSLLPTGIDIDPATRSFTPDSWQRVNDYLKTAVANYEGGRTAGGTAIVVPKFAVDRGMYKPQTSGVGEPLPADVEGFVSSLFGFELPKTARRAQRLPLNIAGQEIRAATLSAAGRPVEIPAPTGAEPTYPADQPWAAGVARPILETNPWRGKLDAAATAAGLKTERISALQRLNLERVKGVQSTPEQTPIRGNTATVSAGFQPRGEAQFEPHEGFTREDTDRLTDLVGRSSHTPAEQKELGVLHAKLAYYSDEFKTAVKKSVVDRATGADSLNLDPYLNEVRSWDSKVGHVTLYETKDGKYTVEHNDAFGSYGVDLASNTPGEGYDDSAYIGDFYTKKDLVDFLEGRIKEPPHNSYEPGTPSGDAIRRKEVTDKMDEFIKSQRPSETGEPAPQEPEADVADWWKQGGEAPPYNPESPEAQFAPARLEDVQPLDTTKDRLGFFPIGFKDEVNAPTLNTPAAQALEAQHGMTLRYHGEPTARNLFAFGPNGEDLGSAFSRQTGATQSEIYDSHGVGGVAEILRNELAAQNAKDGLPVPEVSTPEAQFEPKPTKEVEDRLRYAAPEVKDARGNPKVFFHGSFKMGDLVASESFLKEKQDTSGSTLLGPGFYFTDSPSVAGGPYWKNKIRGWLGKAPVGYAMRPTETGPVFLQHRAPSLDSGSPGVFPAFVDLKNPLNAERNYSYGDLAKLLPKLIPLIENGEHMLTKGYVPTVKILDPTNANEQMAGMDFFRLVRDMSAELHLADGHFGNGRSVHMVFTQQALQAMGFDGAAYLGGIRRGGLGKHNVVVAFEPEQIINAISGKPFVKGQEGPTQYSPREREEPLKTTGETQPEAQFMHSLEGTKRMNDDEMARIARNADTETSRLSSYAGDPRTGLILHSAKLRSTAFITPAQAKDFLAEYKGAKGDRAKSDVIESYFAQPSGGPVQYQPGHITIGTSNDDLSIFGENFTKGRLTPTHDSYGIKGDNNWRYDHDTKTLFWWTDKADLDPEVVSETHAWLKDKGLPVSRTKYLGEFADPESKNYDASHYFGDAQFTPNSDPRAIRAAAVKDPETGKIFEGAMHFNALTKAMEEGGIPGTKLVNLAHGFTTNSGEFLDRAQAYQRATELGQVPASRAALPTATGMKRGLMSEDMKAAQFSPDSEQRDRALELKPALRTAEGKVIPGTLGKTHNDIYNSMPGTSGLELRVDQPEHGFLRGDEFLNRAQAAEHVGQSAPLQSEDLQGMQSAPAAPTHEVSKPIQDWVDKINTTTPQEWSDFAHGAKGGMTMFAHSTGTAARTPADLALLRSTASHYHQLAMAALQGGDDASINLASILSNKSQAAREAFESATGRTMDGTQDTSRVIRMIHDPKYQPPMPPDRGEAAQFSPKTEDEPKTFIVRHGSTGMNAADPAKDRIRGWSNPALSEKGLSEVKQTAKQLKDSGVNTIITSDLTRARQTADAIAEQTGAKVVEDPRLRPWHLGPSIEGKITRDMLPGISSYVESPDKAPPRGESFNTFKDRFLEGFHDAQTKYPDENTALVTHYRGTKLLEAWRDTGTDNDTVNKELFEEFNPEAKPGSFDVVDKTGAEAQFAPGKDKEWKLKAPGISAGGFSKAWITPEGKPIQLGGQYHHVFMAEHPEVRKQYKLPTPTDLATGGGEEIREAALKKGFARVNYNVSSGEITVEARSKDWPTLRPAVEKLAQANAGKLDHFTVHLFDNNVRKMVDSGTEPLFRYSDREKMNHLPLISAPPETTEMSAQGSSAQFAPKAAVKFAEENDFRDMDGKLVPINSDGTITLFHWTNPKSARALREGAKWVSNENQDTSFFSTRPDSEYGAGFGNARVTVRVPVTALAINDAMHGGEIHFTVPNSELTRRNIVPNEASPEIGRTQFSPFKSNEFDSELEKIRSGKSGGQTFTPDGTVWTPPASPSDLVSLASVNVPLGKLNRDTVTEALKPYADLLDEPGVAAGIFAFSKGGVPTVSIDVNAVVPQKYRANTLDFARNNDQVAVWDAAKNEEVPAGGKGNTRLTQPGEILDALDTLRTGKPTDVDEILRQNRETGSPEELQLPGVGGRPALSGGQMANMTKADLAKHFPEAVIPRRQNEPISSDLKNSPLYKAADSEPEAVDTFARKLVEFAKENQEHPSYQSGLRWYSEFVPMLKKRFGADTPIMAELLAGTSPRQSPEVNYAMALDAYQGYKAGRFDKIVSKLEDGLDKIKDGSWRSWLAREINAGKVENAPENPTEKTFVDHWVTKNSLQPRQSNGKLYGISSDAVLKILSRHWLENTEGLKTQNFVRNLLGIGHEATIDMWADRTMRRIGYSGSKERWRILPKNATGVSDPDFKFSQAAFAKAAEELGVKPDALQGGLWFAEKQLWADNGWGRLDLGDFRREIQKTDLLNAGIQQRLAAQRTARRVKPQEQQELPIVEPRP